jgi:hypothetical protein
MGLFFSEDDPEQGDDINPTGQFVLVAGDANIINGMQPAEESGEGLIVQCRKVGQLGRFMAGCRAGFRFFLGFACFCHVFLRSVLVFVTGESWAYAVIIVRLKEIA